MLGDTFHAIQRLDNLFFTFEDKRYGDDTDGEDVPGMDSVLEKRSQEEEERQLQLEEEKEKNKERIRKAYGESASGIGSKNIRKRRHIYIFNPEDLDNADIISMVESSPTYLRDKSTLSTIKTKAATEGQLATEEAQDGEDMGGVITF